MFHFVPYNPSEFKYHLNREKWLLDSTAVQRAYFREVREHGWEVITKVGRGMKAGIVLKKLFRMNLNRPYGGQERR